MIPDREEVEEIHWVVNPISSPLFLLMMEEIVKYIYA
jgi:hypothetical protein